MVGDEAGLGFHREKAFGREAGVGGKQLCRGSPALSRDAQAGRSLPSHDGSPPHGSPHGAAITGWL